MIVRYVCPLTENQRHTLAEIMKHDARPRARVRAHGILLSSQGMRIKEIAKIYQVDRDTVATWIKKWEQSGIASLYDKPRSGRPPKLTPEEKDLARQYIKELPATKGTRINVLGFMNRKNDLHPYMFEQSIHTPVVVACLNDFCQRIKKKTIVIMDNSSIHRSEEFEEYLAQWKKKGLRIKYLIPYAPELNLIEILWRHIKYLWLPFSAYQCMESLREALEHIFIYFGSKYQITFA